MQCRIVLRYRFRIKNKDSHIVVEDTLLVQVSECGQKNVAYAFTLFSELVSVERGAVT